MRTIDRSRAPRDWLLSQGIPASEVPEILSTFVGAPEVCTYRAPHLFIRAHGKASSKPIFRPNYWADGSALADAFSRATQFKGFLRDDEISQIARNYYREITAICHTWNDLASNSFWRIALQGGEMVEGLQGPAASQPSHAATRRTGGTASTSMLLGGGLQVFLNPETPLICTPVDW